MKYPGIKTVAYPSKLTASRAIHDSFMTTANDEDIAAEPLGERAVIHSTTKTAARTIVLHHQINKLSTLHKI